MNKTQPTVNVAEEITRLRRGLEELKEELSTLKRKHWFERDYGPMPYPLHQPHIPPPSFAPPPFKFWVLKSIGLAKMR